MDGWREKERNYLESTWLCMCALAFFASCYTTPTYLPTAPRRTASAKTTSPEPQTKRQGGNGSRYLSIYQYQKSHPPSLLLPTYLPISAHRHIDTSTQPPLPSPPYLWMVRIMFHDSAIHLHLHLHLRGLHTTPQRTHSLTSIQSSKPDPQIIYIPSNFLLFTRYEQGGTVGWGW